jgi:hypothetical protein
LKNGQAFLIKVVNMQKNKPEDNLLKSIINPELKNATKESLELGIDEMTKNKLIKKIPVLDWVLVGYETIISVRDYLFIKKISKFLFEQTKVSIKDRKQWLEKCRKSKNMNKIGSTIIELIDKVNSIEKAKILGMFFRYQINNKITTQEFIRIAEMINAVYLDDLNYFLNKNENCLGELGDEVDHLLSTGFLLRGGSTMGGSQYFPNRKPEHSNYGKVIYKILKKEFKKQRII